MIRLTKEEIEFLLTVLDQVNVQGIPNKKLAVSIMDKLAAELSLTVPPNENKQEQDEK